MLIIIDNYDSFTYNLYQMFAEKQADVAVIRNDKMTVADILAQKPQGIVLSPGPGRPELAGICVELIQALPVSIPLLGVCLGLQAIVYAYGGHIVSAPELVHGKSNLIFHQRQGVYQNCPLPFQAGRYHSLIAERDSLPNVLKIEAETSQGLIMGIAHRHKPIFGVQFHPESILTPEGGHILQNFLQICALQPEGALCA